MGRVCQAVLRRGAKPRGIDALQFPAMHTLQPPDSATRIRELPYAPTPEDLISSGNIEAMRRFLMFSGDGVEQDAARQSLYNAAANGLCHSTDKTRVYRMCVYGWPVTLCNTTPVTVSSTIHLSSPQYPGHSSSGRGLLHKIRELWVRAFGSAPGVLVSPMMLMPHLSRVLDLTPLRLRDATRHGIALVQGAKPRRPWTFDPNEVSVIKGNADLPLTYLLSAWVCWDVYGHEPQVRMDQALTMDMQQLVGAVAARRDGVCVDVLVGRPGVYHDAITQGQGLHWSAMCRRALQLGREFSVEVSQDSAYLHIDMGYLDPLSGDGETVEQWTYPHIWRPMEHLASMQASLGPAFRTLQ